MFAISIILGLAVLTLLSIGLVAYGNETDGAVGFFACVLGSLSAIATLIVLITSVGMTFDWFASGYKADLINREYGTAYTREDVFYASRVIDTIRELDRKRIEVNGDLLREK